MVFEKMGVAVKVLHQAPLALPRLQERSETRSEVLDMRTPVRDNASESKWTCDKARLQFAWSNAVYHEKNFANLKNSFLLKAYFSKD